MTSIQKILVPVDFSEPSKHAITYALSLSLQYKARLIFCHVVPISVALAYALPTESYAIEREEAEKAKEQLPNLIPAEYRDRVKLETIVKIGDVSDELLGVVADENVDLVIMGTHGRGGLERFLLGSLTENMLRKVSVPILTVSNLDAAKDLQSVGPVPLHKILYATDFSENAERGLRLAFDLASAPGAQLSILHVLENLNIGYWSPGITMGYVAEEIDAYRRDSLEKLRQSVAREKESFPGVAAKGLLTEGDPYREILRVASEEHADLIVMNLHGKGRLERALLGSTAERVIRLASVPVLSIPTPLGSLEEESKAVLSEKGTAA